jgi:hypothetical protein
MPSVTGAPTSTSRGSLWPRLGGGPFIVLRLDAHLWQHRICRGALARAEERPILRVITAIAAFTALAAALSISDVTFACEGKICAGDFDCDPHHICMQWPNGSATCEWPGANPVMRASRGSNAESCSNDLECPEGWRCEKQVQHDGVTGSAAQCVSPSHLRISY